MADQNITELPIKTNSGVANTDYMLGIDASEGYQILVRDVAKYIVENYNGTSLAGSSQTIKSAVDALNSKIALNITVSTTDTTDTNANIKAIADGIFTEIGNVNTSFAGNVFVTGHDAYTVTGSVRNSVTKFYCIRTSGNMFKVVRTANGTVTYKEVANKDEVDTLNSNLGNLHVEAIATGADTGSYNFTVVKGVTYLLVVGKVNNATTGYSGLYVVTPHNTSNILPIVASSACTLTITSGTTLTVVTTQTYLNLCLLRLN